MKYDFKYKGMIIFSRYYENKIKSKDKRFYKQLLKAIRNVIAQEFSKVIKSPTHYIQSYFNETQVAENFDIDFKKEKKESAKLALQAKIKSETSNDSDNLAKDMDAKLHLEESKSSNSSEIKASNKKSKKTIILQIEEYRPVIEDNMSNTSEEKITFNKKIYKDVSRSISQDNASPPWYVDQDQIKLLGSYTDITQFDIIKEFDEWLSDYLMHSKHIEYLIESVDSFSSKLRDE